MASATPDNSDTKDDNTSYYKEIASKWATDYPSSAEMESIWSFYKECGYENPQATLLSMTEPVTWETNRLLDYGADKGLMLDFFCTSLNKRLSDSPLKGYGMDINPTALEWAKDKFGPDKYEFKVGDGLSIQYPDKHFDLVVLVATIKHVKYKDRSAVYDELNRVARYVLMVEADEKEEKPAEMMGWTFYNSHFEKEFEENFAEVIKVEKVGGDILGLYATK